MTHRLLGLVWTAMAAAGLSAASQGGEPAAPGPPPSWAAQVEADWLNPKALDQVRRVPVQGSHGVSTQEDARGGCDGHKDGKWGFHTEAEDQPWWQVDLGDSLPLARVLLYNRCDAGTAARLRKFLLQVSDDGQTWRDVYRHDGSVFQGATDGKPLSVSLDGAKARFVRVRMTASGYLHLDEVEVYGPQDPARNLALGRPADQSSVSEWSARHGPASARVDYPIAQVLERGRRLAAHLRAEGVDAAPCLAALDEVERQAGDLPKDAPPEQARALFLKARWAVRRLALQNPLLDFDALVFAKHAPGTFPHMSDQYYGWWSRPGGGIFVLDGFKGDSPRVTCLTGGLPDGSFLRPDLSYDGRRILFAYARYYPHVADERNKAAKDTLPEDAFYHLYEVGADGTGLRRLTHGRYDDLDARYLPDGRVVFLSTRRGQFIQCGKASAAQTLQATLPDCYVRCGGDNYRPVAVYTLHVMDADGGNLTAISPFENFEWTPAVAADGRILYARWDYVDRDNMPYMSLWSTNPDGTHPQSVYGNYTRNPHCIFEARAIPNSTRLIFTASGHHTITGGSLVLLDPDVGVDGGQPITRLTPEVCFPETEGWPDTYYASPWPLSETHYLVAWSTWGLPPHTRVADERNPPNAQGLYLFDVFGNLELLYRDPAISSLCPIPLRPRPAPPAVTPKAEWDGPPEGRLLVQNVYEGLGDLPRGVIKSLRVVAMPAKAQPHMNSPVLGVTHDDPGKCVLGTVPVEADGSAYFRAPAGVAVFFQALDAQGRAVQTMRGLTYVQPGQTLACIGCHDRRDTAPPTMRPTAVARGPSKIAVGPEGSWPLRFDRLVQPVLDARCVRCHSPGKDEKALAKLDLAPAKAYESLVSYGGPAGLREHVLAMYRAGRSTPGQCAAGTSPILRLLTAEKGHHDVRLDPPDLQRLITWMDTYAQHLGSFSADQEQRLLALRQAWADMLESQ